MEAFTTHRGVMAVLDRSNVDTDQIIPKQFLKSIRRTGFGESLFFDWRYLADGRPDPAFELNDPRFSGASILIAGNNFGCGSSREHAVWAIMQYGFRVLIAPSQQLEDNRVPAFADIFRNNGVKNGLLTIELPPGDVRSIIGMVAREGRVAATVDLPGQTLQIHASPPATFQFALDAGMKEHLLRGLDDIGLSQQHAGAISAFEAHHNTQMP
jgi:3-isopropylmalate/(R)-2-methylmalate dehydratase small subunit